MEMFIGLGFLEVEEFAGGAALVGWRASALPTFPRDDPPASYPELNTHGRLF